MYNYNIKKRLVVKNRFRFTVFIILAAAAISLMAFMFMPESTSADISNKTTIVYVSSGDTLWSIADKYTNNGDVREMVYRIKKLNNLNSSNLYPGQQIEVPLD